MKILDRLTLNPKSLFLIDGLGALLTAFLTGVILRKFEDAFGMPQKHLCVLSILACIFAVYSMNCYFFVGKNWSTYLKIIAIANLMYCLLTAILVIVLYQQLTILGIIYFIGEILIILGLVYVELSFSSKNTIV
ncbi:hypothetical protein [Emticicia sp. W12TSBA100-4]|uniref:hypothetical protein n=1 Tax=Emticicia sp. W12TSBA100-4 TaxID=3160965 RepID=UPI0033059746